MVCMTYGDGEIRDTGYVMMQALFDFKHHEDDPFGGYAVLGFESVSSPFNSGHVLFSSFDRDECACKLERYRYELEHFPDDDPDLPFS